MRVQSASGGLSAASEDQLQRLLDTAATLRRAAALVAWGAPLHETFCAVAKAIAQFLNADVTGVLSYEPDGTVAVAGWWGVPGMDLPAGTRLTVADNDVAASVLQSGLPAQTDQFEGPAGSVEARFLQLGVRSGVGAPIIMKNHLWGVVIVAAAQPGRWSPGIQGYVAGLTGLAASAIADAQAQADLNRIAAEQAALRRVAMLVARSATPPEVFLAVADEVGKLLSADVTTVGRFEPDATATIVARVGGDTPVQSRWQLEPPLVMEAVYRTGRPARTDDLDGYAGAQAEYFLREGVRAAVGSPIHVGGRLWGVVVVASRRGQFPAGAEQRITDFTELAATAIANADSRAELLASRARIVAASDRARRDIERDLHDGVQQRLVSLALMLRSAQQQVPARPPELDAAMSRAAEGLGGVLAELQEISRGIHPAILSQGGLAPALKTLARRSAIPVQVGVRSGGRLPEQVEVAAYYVVAEALANVAKHARASAAHVDVDVDADELRLRVSDDGIGGADPGRGSGLIGLHDRVEALGGTMQVHSPIGEGTSLLVTLPTAGG